MALTTFLALFFTMLVLAAVPSISVITVISRAASHGFIHGAFTAAGIVLGDLVFIAIAIFGLSVLADKMGELFIVIKTLGGAWLLWLGFSLWHAEAVAAKAENYKDRTLFSSFIAGLLITLADQKAILFYFGFFPAFVDLAAISYTDAGIIILITIIAVGGAKLGYALMADRAGRLFSHASTLKAINYIAGAVMIAVGLSIMIRA